MDITGLASIAVAFLQKPAKRIRYPAGTWTRSGDYTAASAITTDIKAVIQPFNDASRAENKMDVRPDRSGDSMEDYVIIWTKDDIRAVNETAGTPPDIVEGPDGRRFKIMSLSARKEGGFNRAVGGLIYDRGRSL